MDAQSVHYENLFDALCSARAKGLGEYVDLPQMVICGDYPPGKSAVLDALGMRAAESYSKERRFFTEFVLRPTGLYVDRPHFVVTIIPGNERPEDEKERLREFSREFESYMMHSIEHILREARAEIERPGFDNLLLRDTVRIEIHDADFPRLILVDPPNAAPEDQDTLSTYNDAVEERMIQYIQNPRSIVLAIIDRPSSPVEEPHPDDPQCWLPEIVRKFDDARERTIGLVIPPSEYTTVIPASNYIDLPKNEKLVLKLGWNALKEPPGDRVYHRSRGRYFLAVADLVKSALCGPVSFREHLGKSFKDILELYQKHIIADIKTQLSFCKAKTTRISSVPRSTSKHLGSLVEASKSFTALIRAAMEGDYTDTFFRNGEFCVSRRGDGVYWSPLKDLPGNGRQLRDIMRRRIDRFGKRMTKDGRAHRILEEHQFPSHEKDIRRSDYVEQVSLLVQQTRGSEPPGTVNSLAISAVFADQSRQWRDIVHQELNGIIKEVANVVKNVVNHIASSPNETQLLAFMNPAFERLKARVVGKVEGLLSTTLATQAATFSSFTVSELARDLRLSRERAGVDKWLKSALGLKESDGPKKQITVDPTELIKRIQSEVSVDLERQAAELAIDYSEAHYQITLNRVIQEFGSIIENDLVQNLPAIFDMRSVLLMSDAEMRCQTDAAEDVSTATDVLQEEISTLKDCLAMFDQLKVDAQASQDQSDCDTSTTEDTEHFNLIAIEKQY
ncbi:dynamin family protein [Colletotrichum sojae]|uniref:Dynamin family protein n=1 Tax=Colletotrichum sojae TaxID=2175907 RepID=A0A8H6IQ69_9PEZI|nr:dynamin family protein [Colletotrichum sojae]